MKKFDLNIEEILENWEPKHAVREIIANAIDEQIITNCKEIEIYKDNNNKWYIRDYGRGIKHEHFTQKENKEKLSNEGLIGKFGIGLKDALATFNRKGIQCKIKSKNGFFEIGKSSKTDFSEIETLHVYINDASDKSFIGTEFTLKGISDIDIKNAKDFFLKFNGNLIIETTKYGQILENENSESSIYINGVQVASEPNFLFSYNVTSLNKTLRKALNRERSNVGRSAYSSLIRSILLSSKSETTARRLSGDLMQFSSGAIHDELKWIDVQSHAATILSKSSAVVFVTPEEIEKGNNIIDEARRSNLDVVTISGALKNKIAETNEEERRKLETDPDADVEIVKTFNEYAKERNANFEFDFVAENNLNFSECQIHKEIDRIVKLIGGKPYNVYDILISETMQRDNYSFMPVAGLWDSAENRVIIKRSQLSSLNSFAGTLIHEIAHAKSRASDATRDFERQLTDYCGLLATQLIAALNKLKSLNLDEIGNLNIQKIANIQIKHDNAIRDLEANLRKEFEQKLLKAKQDTIKEEKEKSLFKRIFG